MVNSDCNGCHFLLMLSKRRDAVNVTLGNKNAVTFVFAFSQKATVLQ